MEIKCARCGQKLNEKKYLIQTIIYLGSNSPRMNLCKDCYDAFRDFMDECGANDDEED